MDCCVQWDASRKQLDSEMKHPVILPHRHHVADLIIKDHHTNVGHMGQETVLSFLTRKYWIVKDQLFMEC